MQGANFCPKHGGEEAQSGQRICSLPGVSVETHLSINLTAVWLSALTAPAAEAHSQAAKHPKKQEAPFFTLSAEKAALIVPGRALICIKATRSHLSLVR